MKKLLAPLLLVLAAFMGFTMAFSGTALAASAAAPTDGSLLDLLKPLIDDVTSGHYLLASAAGLVLLVALVRRYLAPRWAFLGTDAGGALLVLLGSFATGAVGLLAGGAALSWSAAGTALLVAFTAAGGYATLNKLLTPLEAKAPAWMQPLFRLVTWIFDEVAPGQSAALAETQAAQAGVAAVAAKPATGAAATIGEATELK
jgi:hypothetical protein